MDYVTVDKKVYRADGKNYCSILSDRVDGLPGKPRNDHQITIAMAVADKRFQVIKEVRT